MRPVLISDLRAVMRVLVAAIPEDRARLCRRIVREAELADRYTRRLGRVHPQWGNGTLMAAAARFPMGPELSWNRPAGLASLRCLTEALAAERDDDV
ncbi:MAG: hypothetical protein HKN30_15670 [Sulfitobacter sp.]|nr:hypothetical protein [Sulfitobacter sp.]